MDNLDWKLCWKCGERKPSREFLSPLDGECLNCHMKKTDKADTFDVVCGRAAKLRGTEFLTHENLSRS